MDLYVLVRCRCMTRSSHDLEFNTPGFLVICWCISAGLSSAPSVEWDIMIYSDVNVNAIFSFEPKYSRSQIQYYRRGYNIQLETKINKPYPQSIQNEKQDKK